MDVYQLIRNYLQNPIADEVLQQKTQAIASDLSIDLSTIINVESNTFDEATVKLLAEEIDRTASTLATVESNGGAVIAPPENGKGKKAKKGAIQTSQSQSVESLKPAVQNLKTAVSGEAEAMLQVFNQKAEQVENAVTGQIMARCKQINPNIISKVSQELQEYTNESTLFRGQIESVFDEAFADFLNPAT